MLGRRRRETQPLAEPHERLARYRRDWVPASTRSSLGAASSAASAATPVKCSGTFAQGFFFGVKATGLSCPAARGVVRSWLKAIDFKSGHGVQPGSTTLGAWTCKLTIRGERGTVACRSGAKRVAFIGNP